ncbi:acetyl-CoA carboxylase biotin carboxylase subunit [Piscinibacter koreensis]|uniref:ATP-grasp domain-containing protein n=1 Tax=Piscinibacter koreensis TaxID=2742824 RepID=A0A7Y6NK68_9BURK|nr:biotin carboxylase N-terminal domain-containing protein [Schlegelella koreensis]NUZ04696.1 ATP-grasp domain-containing protein [Schlegelella koreensis]
MFTKVVVANRGAVAARVLRTLRAMGIGSVAVFSDADANAPYLALADEAYRIGPAPARESYLDVAALLGVARASGADALHPGYGFLSENAAFASAVEAAGVRFIGPSPRWIEAMGHKTRARELAAAHGMPVGRGSTVLSGDTASMLAAAEAIGYPVLVKPASGGGGIGMLPARSAAELPAAIDRATSMAQRGFANAEVYLERLVERPRHVEFQVLGDRHGSVRHLFERDCSVQRRHQKVIEESPAPDVDRAGVDTLADRIAATLQDMGYDNIGTVEMLMAPDGTFSFLEMNTRLQVEHGVTEEVTGIDLVAAQIRAAAGERLADILPAHIEPAGHAIQARVYAEDPTRFLPSPGPLAVFQPPTGVRVETGYAEGGTVTPHYDPMLAKVIAHAPTREAAIERLVAALGEFRIEGVKHNIPALLRLLDSPEFRAGDVHTGLLPEVIARS